MNIQNMKQSFAVDEEDLIGEGAFSKVYRSGTTTETTAVKVYEKSRESADLIQHAKRQHNILQHVQSPYVCSLRKSFETNRKFYMFQKFQQGESLNEQLRKKKRFSCKEAVSIFKQILNAMEYLINKKIMHRDLKPQNIIYRNGKIVLIDFGFACYFHKNDQKILTAVVGTPNYMSPQLLYCKKYNSKSDIWSLGVILYELISGELPFEGKDARELLKNIESKSISFKNNLFSPIAEYLISKCLKINTHQRLQWKELFQWKDTGKLPESKYNGSVQKRFKYQLSSIEKLKEDATCGCNIFNIFE